MIAISTTFRIQNVLGGLKENWEPIVEVNIAASKQQCIPLGHQVQYFME